MSRAERLDFRTGAAEAGDPAQEYFYEQRAPKRQAWTRSKKQRKRAEQPAAEPNPEEAEEE
eukprot:5902813-Lingulodinium_polyedra.AAC.1